MTASIALFVPSSDWKRDTDPGPLAGTALDIDLPLVPGDDPVDDGEPEPRALFLRREKRVENPRQVIGVDPDPGVGEDEGNLFSGFLHFGPDREHPPALHRFARVDHEVDEYLLDLGGVGEDLRKRFDAVLDRDVVQSELILQQSEGFIDQPGKVCRLAARLLGPREVEQVPDDG